MDPALRLTQKTAEALLGELSPASAQGFLRAYVHNPRDMADGKKLRLRTNDAEAGAHKMSSFQS